MSKPTLTFISQKDYPSYMWRAQALKLTAVALNFNFLIMAILPGVFGGVSGMGLM